MFSKIVRVGAFAGIALCGVSTPVFASGGACAVLARDPGLISEYAAQDGFEAVLAELGQSCPAVLAMLDLPQAVTARYMPDAGAEQVAAKPLPPVDPMLAALHDQAMRLEAAVAAVEDARARVDAAVGRVASTAQTGLFARMVEGLTVSEATAQRLAAIEELTAARLDLADKRQALDTAQVATAAAVAVALGQKNEAAAALAQAVSAKEGDNVAALLSVLEEELGTDAAKLAAALSDAKKEQDAINAAIAEYSAAIIDAKAKAEAAIKIIKDGKGLLTDYANEIDARKKAREARLADGDCDQACDAELLAKIAESEAKLTALEKTLVENDLIAQAEDKRAANAAAELDSLNSKIVGLNADVTLIETKKQAVDGKVTALATVASASTAAAAAHRTAIDAAATEISAKQGAVDAAMARLDAAVSDAEELAELSDEEQALLDDLEAARGDLDAAVAGLTTEINGARALVDAVGDDATVDVADAADALRDQVDEASGAAKAADATESAAGDAVDGLEAARDSLTATLD